MPTPTTPKHAPHWVAYGPPNTRYGASDWCVIDNPDPKHIAPGGVVLCNRGTTQPHPYAENIAREAWAVYGQYIAAITPSIVNAWEPAELVTQNANLRAWRNGNDFTPSHRAPGGWYLIDLSDKENPRVYLRNDYYTELEWARLAKIYVGTGVDNPRARPVYAAAPVWLPPLPTLTESDVRNANKYNRRAITTKADRIAGEKIIKWLVARAS